MPRLLIDGRSNPVHPAYATQKDRFELEGEEGLLDRFVRNRNPNGRNRDQGMEMRNVRLRHVYTRDGMELPVNEEEYSMLLAEAHNQRVSAGSRRSMPVPMARNVNPGEKEEPQPVPANVTEQDKGPEPLVNVNES